MKGQWKEVVRLTFKGERFRDHALDLSAINELSQFQKMATETAKALWHAANPKRERLPKLFEERTRLCLRKVEDGSAVAPLEVFIEQPEQGEIFEQEPTEIKEALALVEEVFHAVEKDEPFPDKFQKSLLLDYEPWGKELLDDEAIEISTNGRSSARITPDIRSRLSSLIERTHESHGEVAGEVLEADVRQRHFQLWLDDKTKVAASFSEEQEDAVIDALKNHKTVRLRVRGQVEYSDSGGPVRIANIEDLQIQTIGEIPYDSSARPIEDILAELAREVPEEEWKKLPADLTDNLDHYIYGTPKQ